jgi:antitoxin (DNA-binding transcriptional repressor) of toxin-antitoxin stability system
MTYVIRFEDTHHDIQSLLEQAAKGDEIILLRNSAPFVRIMPPAQNTKRVHFGMAKNIIGVLPQDFDQTPDEFKEYCE